MTRLHPKKPAVTPFPKLLSGLFAFLHLYVIGNNPGDGGGVHPGTPQANAPGVTTTRGNAREQRSRGISTVGNGRIFMAQG